MTLSFVFCYVARSGESRIEDLATRLVAKFCADQKKGRAQKRKRTDDGTGHGRCTLCRMLLQDDGFIRLCPQHAICGFSKKPAKTAVMVAGCTAYRLRTCAAKIWMFQQSLGKTKLEWDEPRFPDLCQHYEPDNLNGNDGCVFFRFVESSVFFRLRHSVLYRKEGTMVALTEAIKAAAAGAREGFDVREKPVVQVSQEWISKVNSFSGKHCQQRF